MANYDTFSALFKRLKNDINDSMEHIIDDIVEVWKDMMTESYYGQYTPSVYNRKNSPFQTIESIRVLELSTTNGVFKANIGYDDRLIIEYEAIGLNGRPYTSHEDKPNMDMIVEYGFTMGNGEFREGGHVYEYLKSDQGKKKYIIDKFNELMRKKGYIVK